MDIPLKAVQERAHNILSAHAPGGFFLRRFREDDCLFVSDLPRHVEGAVLEDVLAALEEEGFQCSLFQKTGLIHMDLSLDGYERLLADLAQELPPFPRQEAFHPAYGLCRLLHLHPAPVRDQPLEPLRRLLKACAWRESPQVLQSIPGIHEKCAGWLREGKCLPQGAGLVLGTWLLAQERALDEGGGPG